MERVCGEADYVSPESGGRTRAGRAAGQCGLPLAPLGYADAESFIAAGDRALHAAGALMPVGKATACRLPDVQLLAPLLHPPRIFCVGLNYSDHAAESKMAVQAVPTIFMKLCIGASRVRTAISFCRRTASSRIMKRSLRS